MSFLDDLLGSLIQLNGVNEPQRKILNFLGSVTIADNPSNGSTDITISASPTVTTYSGSNPNTDNVPGTRGSILQNTGPWNGYTGWVAMVTGTPATWVTFGRAGTGQTVAASYQALNTDKGVTVSSTASVRTITLPDVTTIAVGFDLSVNDGSFSNTGNNTLVVGHASENINGSSSFAIIADGNGNSFTFTWNGTQWRVS